MASVFQRGSKWYLRVKDSTGRWINRVTVATTKTEAKRLAGDVERKAERVRFGLEAAPPEDGGGTLGDLMAWWLDSCDRGAPSHSRNRYTIQRHIIGTDLARLPLVQVTAPKIEAFLDAKAAEGLSAQTVNHLRGYLSRAFQSARRLGRYTGPNPVAEVRKRRVPSRTPDYLRADEVPLVMAALDEGWRPLFATALHTGMRKGELLALRKTDVDLGAGLIMVRRSWGRDTTKGGHADAIPIAADLAPFLKAAIAVSPSALVFPAADGSMMREQVKLHDVLRRALARAGIVQGYRHACRARTNGEGRRDPVALRCTHSEVAADRAQRRCPTHGDLLWPKAEVRPIRFHDLRHTTASLLMMAGVNPAAVQRILRHSDPKITTEVYGHLSPGYLRAEVDRLAFGLADTAPAAVPNRAVAGAEATPFAASLLQDDAPGKIEAGTPPGSGAIPASLVAGCRGLEPLASGVTGGHHGPSTFPTVPNRSEPLGQRHIVITQPTQPTGTVPNRLAAPLLHGPSTPAPAGAALRVVDGGKGHLLTVRAVAGRLGVSTATV